MGTRDGGASTMTKPTSKHHSFLPAHQPPVMQTLSEPSYQTAFFHQQHQAQDSLRLVRFLLSPTSERKIPERKMKTRSSSSQVNQIVVLPTAPKEEEWKFGSANTWHSEHLAKLGVSFWRAKHINLESVLEVQESNWTQAMRDKVALGVKQLSSVEVTDLEEEKVDMETVNLELAPQFSSTFESLVTVRAIEERKKRAKEEREAKQSHSEATSSVDQSRKRPPQSPIAEQFSKRTRAGTPLVDVPSPKTPERPTVVPDPNYTGNTVESGASTRSKDEENTKVLVNTFIADTMRLLGSAFCNVKWQQSGRSVVVVHSSKDTMKFNLGVEEVTAISDGGMVIRYNDGMSWINFQPGNNSRPVLAVEAKRLSREKHKLNRKDIETKYASQIFCEMLGMTCHREFFENSALDFQNAFVIHARHSHVVIYCTRLPNAYLSDVHQYGSRYLDKVVVKHKIQLRRTRTYLLGNTDDRVALFKLLAKLLYYMVSGKAHTGYLYNYPINPLHTIGKVIHDTIQVQEQPEEDVNSPETPSFAKDLDNEGDSSITDLESDQARSAEEEEEEGEENLL